MQLEPRKKKSLAWSLAGHGLLLMAVFLGAAFMVRPKPNYITLEIAGGPGGGGPPPAAAEAEPQPNPPAGAETPKPAPPQPQEFPTRKKEPEKPRPVLKTKPPEPVKPPARVKPAPPKTASKPARNTAPQVKVSKKTVTRSAGPVARSRESRSVGPAGESAASIRKRFESRLGTGGGGPTEGRGSGSVGDPSVFATYLAGLEEDIQNAWEQPSAAAAGLTATAEFYLEKDGRFTGIRISKSSGNAELDQSALLAVKGVGKYRPWPENFPPEQAKILFDFVCKPNQ